MPVNTSYPLSGDICYSLETTYNGGHGATRYYFSDAVINARIGTGDVNQELMNIDNRGVVSFQLAMIDPVLHVEYYLQPNAATDALYYATDISECDLASIAIEAGANLCSTASKAYFHMYGCKVKSYTVSAAKGELWKVAMDFSVGSFWVSTATVTSFPAADISKPYAAFNIAGGITWAGVTGAYATQGFSFTVDNGLNDIYTVGSRSKSASIPGILKITGTCDITMDKGGYTNFSEVLNATDITSLILNTGLTSAGGAGKFTLSNGRFDSTEIDINTSGEGIITSVPFTFKSIAIAAGT